MAGLSIIMLALQIAFTSSAWGKDKSGRVTTVVIDAGHGGKDPGALGLKSREKDITLKVALKAGELIRSQHSDVKVIYTRTRDEFIELHRRAEVANKNKADLFISIHCNSHKSRTHYGAETFVMGLHRSQANLEVARFENAAILYEDDYKENYQGFDPNSPESYIIFSMYQNIYREQSLLFASLVQEELSEQLRRFDRGVKEAGFLVLYRTTMPSVLVELGFISNAAEEEYLRSAQGQQQLAASLAGAFSRYREHVEQNSKPREVISQTRTSKSSTADVPFDTPSMEPPRAETLSVTQSPPPMAEKPTGKADNNDSKRPSESPVIWRVQIVTSGSRLPRTSPRFKGMQNIFEYHHQGTWKYTVGAFSTEQEALQYRNQVRKQGFSDAFVVPFIDNVRISPEEARKKQVNNP
ncbi:MAG: N-acetylmuramoyl-L-alanine amidase [Bacteroidales bacterium]